MKINFSLKNIARRLLKNLGWLFFAGFILLVLFEAFEINASAQMVLQSKQEPPPIKLEKGVRINFENYNEVVNRIQLGDSYEPTGGITKDPFSNSLPAAGSSTGSSSSSPASGANSDDSGGVLKLN